MCYKQISMHSRERKFTYIGSEVSDHTVDPPYLWVPHLWIQPTANEKCSGKKFPKVPKKQTNLS